MRALVPLLCLLPLLIAPARANDTSAALAAGGLEFKRTDAVEMRSEDLFISMDEVRVRYVFRNRTNKAVTLHVAFPLPELKADMQESPLNIPDAGETNFVGFKTLVDGKPIGLKTDRQARYKGKDVTSILVVAGAPLNPLLPGFSERIAKLPEAERAKLIAQGLIGQDQIDQGKGWERYYRPTWDLSTTYYRDQTFPAGKDVVVEHSYRPVVGATVMPVMSSVETWKVERKRYQRAYCVDEAFETAGHALNPEKTQERWISYILKTGANWAGPIGEFRLVVDKGAAENLVSFCGDKVKKISPTQFEMRAKGFTPHQNLNVLILTPAN
jgi:Domain of unknown function (DUF4424)